MSWQEMPVESWRAYGGMEFPTDAWDVREGVLYARPNAARVDLISRNRYRNFLLSLEWRLPEAGNSGVLYHVTETWEAAWQSGPKMQLLDDQHHPDGQRPETRCGALYALLAPEQGFFPADPTFKKAQLVVRDNGVEHWLNGMRVLSYSLDDPKLKERIAESTFRDFPGFGQGGDGHIVLQHHGTEAWFRNIKIQPLH